MNLTLAVSPETSLKAICDTLSDFFSVEKTSVQTLSRQSLEIQGNEIANGVRRELIAEHPLHTITNGAFEDLIDHARAIDLLGKSRSCLMHVRHIEEVVTILEFIVGRSERYNEFAWRWDNFKTAHAIRNRILNLKKDVDPLMQAWIDKNLTNLKKVSSKFTGAATKDHDTWEKYASWLTPINLKDVFEGVRRKPSYSSQMYDWNSQAVHFSPLGGTYLDYELTHQNYYEFAVETAERHLHSLLRVLLPLAANPARLRDLHARLVLLSLHRLVSDRPQQFNELTQTSEQFAQLLAELIRQPREKERIQLVLLGKPPEDPLVLNVTSVAPAT